MKVVIIGAGEAGYHVIGALYREGVDIVAVDWDPAVLERLNTEFNVTTLQGNATDSDVLEAAGVADCDLFLAVTNYDETNIISCLLAGEYGAARKIARVKTIEIGEERAFTDRQYFGIDYIINPYEVAAEHLEMLVRHPQVTDFNQFLGDRVLLVRIPIAPRSPLAGTSVMSFGQQARIPQTLIALVQRQGQSLIPNADTVLQAEDQVYFFCARDQYPRLVEYLGLSGRSSRRVFINGGGHIGYALAKRLESRRERPLFQRTRGEMHPMEVRILEVNAERCEQLSDMLDHSLVLHADGTDSASLRGEGVEHADFFVSVTAEDQTNVVSCLLAAEYGAAKTVALVKQPEYIPIITRRGLIDVAFSPRLLTARKVLRFVRGEQLSSFFAFPNSDVELLELEVQAGVPCEERRIADLNLPPGVLVGAVKRGEEIFIPRGHDTLHRGDTILLLQQRRNRRVTRSLFLERDESSPTPARRAAHG